MNSPNQAATQSELVTPVFHRNGSRYRPLHKRAMQFLRRAHLYIGLFMIPWVLVYAITGFLFNHGVSLMPEQEFRPVTTDNIRGTGLDTLPSPAELAAEVTEILNTRAGRPEYRLSTSVAASFEGEFQTGSRTGMEEASLYFDLITKTGHVDVKPATVEPPAAPFGAAEGVFGRARLEEQLKAGAPAVLERLGVSAGKLEVRRLPEVTFAVIDAAGTEWKVGYDPKSGAIRGRPASFAEPEMGFKQFLCRLHVTFGYPPSSQLGRVWAVFVDLTACALFFWCATGLLMWWQIKAVRRAGVFVLVSSAVTATLLGLAMHGAMAH